MNTIRSSLCSVLLLVVACARPAPRSLAGLWIYQEPWTHATPLPGHDQAPRGFARGIVLRFCPNGRFRMATGLFNGTTPAHSYLSDYDVALYEGTWTQNGESVIIRYKLTGVKSRWMVEHPDFDGHTLVFSYRRPSDGRRFPYRFRRGEGVVTAQYVECNGSS